MMTSLSIKVLEIPASRVFLGADAQLLGTSLAGARMPLTISITSHLKLNIRSSASPCSTSCWWDGIYKSFAFIRYKGKY